MKIGIDISQLAYENTGVANYLGKLIESLVKNKNNEYILFFSSLRRQVPYLVNELAKNDNVKIKKFKLPPSVLDLLWNKFHKIPIEDFIGDIDVFISSDWTEPPTRKAKKATILYDLIIYKFPQETDHRIVNVQKNKLSWVKKETDIIFCISDSTKKDANEILGIDASKLNVVYPGF